MASKRMFSADIIRSDGFGLMTPAAQALYLQLCMSADDEGFVGGCKLMCRMIGADECCLDELHSFNFLHIFDSGVGLIIHWWVHNARREELANRSSYTAEKRLVCFDPESKRYNILKSPREDCADMPEAEEAEQNKKRPSISGGERDEAAQGAAVQGKAHMEFDGSEDDALPLPKRLVRIAEEFSAGREDIKALITEWLRSRRRKGGIMADAIVRLNLEKISSAAAESGVSEKELLTENIRRGWRDIYPLQRTFGAVGKICEDKPQAEPKRYGDFDVKEAFELALERSYGAYGYDDDDDDDDGEDSAENA